MGENTFEDVKVKEKQSVTLTCEVTGKGLSSLIFPQLTGYSLPSLTSQLVENNQAFETEF